VRRFIVILLFPEMCESEARGSPIRIDILAVIGAKREIAPDRPSSPDGHLNNPLHRPADWFAVAERWQITRLRQVAGQSQQVAASGVIATNLGYFVHHRIFSSSTRPLGILVRESEARGSLNARDMRAAQHAVRPAVELADLTCPDQATGNAARSRVIDRAGNLGVSGRNLHALTPRIRPRAIQLDMIPLFSASGDLRMIWRPRALPPYALLHRQQFNRFCHRFLLWASGPLTFIIVTDYRSIVKSFWGILPAFLQHS
jgi:hypothetical protein